MLCSAPFHLTYSISSQILLFGLGRSFEDCVTSDDEVDGAGATDHRLELDLKELDEFDEDGDATLASLAPTKE
jgi:hypothetical protein